MELSVGRSENNDIVLNHPHLSRRHARFIIEGESLWIEDFGSLNGTSVNGSRISGRVPIQWDSEVLFGDVAFDLGTLREHVRARARQAQRVEPRFKPVPEPIDEGSKPPGEAPAPSHVRAQRQEARVEESHPDEKSEGGVSVGYDVVRALESQKSYVGKAFAAFVLYLFFWLPGFVMNIIFLSDANQTKRLVGSSPSGYGCLVSLLWLFVYIPIILIVILAIVSYGTLEGLIDSVGGW